MNSINCPCLSRFSHFGFLVFFFLILLIFVLFFVLLGFLLLVFVFLSLQLRVGLVAQAVLLVFFVFLVFLVLLLVLLILFLLPLLPAVLAALRAAAAAVGGASRRALAGAGAAGPDRAARLRRPPGPLPVRGLLACRSRCSRARTRPRPSPGSGRRRGGSSGRTGGALALGCSPRSPPPRPTLSSGDPAPRWDALWAAPCSRSLAPLAVESAWRLDAPSLSDGRLGSGPPALEGGLLSRTGL